MYSVQLRSIYSICPKIIDLKAYQIVIKSWIMSGSDRLEIYERVHLSIEIAGIKGLLLIKRVSVSLYVIDK